MNDEKLKKQLGANIVAYRKRSGLTQAGLAEKLNYSDKAVSKWERAESMPDLLTLVQLAELFDVTVNDLLADPDALPENSGAVQRAVEIAVEKTLRRKADKKVIRLLANTLVWFIALLVFVVLSVVSVPKGWVAFFYAIPVDAIVQLSLRSAWHDFRRNSLLISLIMWGSLLSIFVTIVVFVNPALWVSMLLVFLLGIPGQLAIFLWFRMFRKPVKEDING